MLHTKSDIKGLNVLIDTKIFFDVPVKSKEGAYEIVVELIKNNDYATDNLLYYESFLSIIS